MSRIIGTVTRTLPDTIAQAQQTAQGNRACFSASLGSLSLGGAFRSAREAQAAVQSALGGALARWTREDLAGSIERYVGRTGRDDPREIYGDDLLLWIEADGGIVFIGTGAPDVAIAGDRSGNRNNLSSVAGLEPSQVGLTGMPSLLFAGGERMTTSLSLDPGDPLTISLVAAPAVAGGARVMVQTSNVVNLTIQVSAPPPPEGVWQLLTSGPTISGAASGIGINDVVQATYVPTPLQAELYINNGFMGGSTGSFTAGTLNLGAALVPWIGNFSGLVVARDADKMKRLQTYLYFSEKYNTA